jgi:hypothetical protein
METSVRSSTRPLQDVRRRLVLGGAALAATAAVGVGLLAPPADAARNDPCATARAVFRSYMNEARFWIGASDRLASAGNESGANQASDEAGYYLGLAEGALGDMSTVC